MYDFIVKISNNNYQNAYNAVLNIEKLFLSLWGGLCVYFLTSFYYLYKKERRVINQTYYSILDILGFIFEILKKKENEHYIDYEKLDNSKVSTIFYCNYDFFKKYMEDWVQPSHFLDEKFIMDTHIEFEGYELEREAVDRHPCWFINTVDIQSAISRLENLSKQIEILLDLRDFMTKREITSLNRFINIAMQHRGIRQVLERILNDIEECKNLKIYFSELRENFSEEELFCLKLTEMNTSKEVLQILDLYKHCNKFIEKDFWKFYIEHRRVHSL